MMIISPLSRPRRPSSLAWLARLAALVLWLTTVQPTVAAPAVPLARYEIVASLDLDTGQMQAEQIVHLTNLTGRPLQSLVLHSMAGAMGRLSLEAALVDGQPVAPIFDATGSVLELLLPAELGPGQSVAAVLHWSLQLPPAPGRLSISADGVSLGNWFPTLAVHRGAWDRRPFTEVGDAFFTETADFRVRLSLSRPAVVAATGEAAFQDGTTWELTAGNVRDFALAVSPFYYQAERFLEGGPLVRVYAFDPGRAEDYAEMALHYLAAFASLIGPYPYQQVTIAETNLPASYQGMEYPQMIFLANGLARTPSETRALIGHELAHQWFYGLIGNDQLADPWLDEAFATYLVIQADESSSPADASHPSLATPALGPIDQGVFDFSSDPPYFQVVYRRGGQFLAELRQAMGEQGWAAFLRSLYATYRGKLATPRAVLDLAQQQAPQVDLAPLIERYTRYGARGTPVGRAWAVHLPAEPWQGLVPLTVSADFPVSFVEFWLDQWRIAAGGTAGTYLVDASPVPAGEYVLLVRLTDAEGAILERASRVAVQP